MTKFTLAELQEIGWRAFLDSPRHYRIRQTIDAVVKAVYENTPSAAVVPLRSADSISAALQRFDASSYKHALLVAIEEPTLKPDVFSFGNGANPMEEIAALFTATRIRSEGTRR